MVGQQVVGIYGKKRIEHLVGDRFAYLRKVGSEHSVACRPLQEIEAADANRASFFGIIARSAFPLQNRVEHRLNRVLSSTGSTLRRRQGVQ